MGRTNSTSSRIAQTRALMRVHNVDALLLINLEDGKGINIRYLSGFTGSASVLLLTHEAQILRTDFRYELQVPQESEGWDIRLGTAYKLSDLAQLIKECAPSRLGLIEEEVSWKRVNEFRKELPDVELIPLPNIVKEIRAAKDIGEIEAIRSAVRMMEEVLRELYAMVRPGVTTDCELATALKVKLIERGSDVSFPPIIVSGSDSAFIHGNPFKLRRERELKGIVPVEKVIQRGDIIQFDVGCMVDGYASDISRVVVVGKATDEQRRVHRTILEAIEEAKKYYRPGVRGGRAFEEAERILKAHGFEKGIVHGLGHSIGLEVHDGFPRVTKDGNDVLRPGNIISLEPGIYREGYGGMRIERDVLITEGEPEFLDELTTDLIEL